MTVETLDMKIRCIDLSPRMPKVIPAGMYDELKRAVRKKNMAIVEKAVPIMYAGRVEARTAGAAAANEVRRKKRDAKAISTSAEISALISGSDAKRLNCDGSGALLAHFSGTPFPGADGYVVRSKPKTLTCLVDKMIVYDTIEPDGKSAWYQYTVNEMQPIDRQTSTGEMVPVEVGTMCDAELLYYDPDTKKTTKYVVRLALEDYGEDKAWVAVKSSDAEGVDDWDAATPQDF